MDKFFKLQERGTNIRREVVAGITTFLTMAYIIAVNPAILSAAGMPAGPVVTSTCLAAAFTTILMGLYANLPFALASGMGLNAFFAFTIVIRMKAPWQVALAAVFVEGIIFIILSLTKVREAVVDIIPLNLKLAVTAGVGLFIAFIGFVDSGIVVKNDSTIVSLGNFITPPVLITVLGTIIIVVLAHNNVKGSILWGIVTSTIVSWLYAFISPAAAAYYKIGLPQGIFKFESLTPIFAKFDFSYMTDKTKIWNFILIIFTILFVDFFDTLGTLVGVASKANMLDENGKVPSAGKALLVDAIGTTFAGLVGTSTVTAYIESSAGVAEGGRTGLTAVVTGILLLLSMFFAPLFIAIPSCATAPALIVVGFFMMEQVVKINFSDFTEGFPAFITIAAMPLTYSIGDGLMLGILSYFIVNFINNIVVKDKSKKKKISLIMYILAVLFLIKIIVSGLQGI